MKKFLSSYPELVKEWHPTKNDDLTPSNFTHGSMKKVWWKCHKGHEWSAMISNRTKKIRPRGCPECAGTKTGEDNNLLVLFPDVAKEWHPTKNKDLTPSDFTRGSKEKVWWLCPKGHDYDLVINKRTNMERKGLPCPYCDGRKKMTSE